MSLGRRVLFKAVEVVALIALLIAAWFLVQSSAWPLGILFATGAVLGFTKVFSRRGASVQDAAMPAEEEM